MKQLVIVVIGNGRYDPFSTFQNDPISRHVFESIFRTFDVDKALEAVSLNPANTTAVVVANIAKGGIQVSDVEEFTRRLIEIGVPDNQIVTLSQYGLLPGVVKWKGNMYIDFIGTVIRASGLHPVGLVHI